MTQKITACNRCRCFTTIGYVALTAVASQQAKSALRHQDIVGHIQQGRGGQGTWKSRPSLHKATTLQHQRLVVEELCQQEKSARRAKTVSQAKQGQWMQWEEVEKQKLTWKELRGYGSVSGKLGHLSYLWWSNQPKPVVWRLVCPKHIPEGCVIRPLHLAAQPGDEMPCSYRRNIHHCLCCWCRTIILIVVGQLG